MSTHTIKERQMAKTKLSFRRDVKPKVIEFNELRHTKIRIYRIPKDGQPGFWYPVRFAGQKIYAGATLNGANACINGIIAAVNIMGEPPRNEDPKAGTLESIIKYYKQLSENLRYDVEVAGKTIVQNTSTIKQLKEKAAAAERKLGNVAFTINRIAQTLTEISKPGEMPIQDIIEQSKCIHCERGVQLDGDTHIWEDGSHAFCPRKLKLTEVAGMTIGLNQQVYSSQWGCEYIVCYKCGKLLNLNACWLDLDGSQRHQSCLSKERLDQLQKA
jgi:hypothetical protein